MTRGSRFESSSPAYLPAPAEPDPPPWWAYWGMKPAIYNPTDDGSWLVMPLGQFGLTGDDSPNINYALQQAGRVRLAPTPAAAFTCQTPIVMPARSILTGAGAGSQITWDQSVVPVLIQGSGTTQHVGIRDLRLSQINPTPGGTAIDASQFQFARIERVLIDKTAGGANPNIGVQHNAPACHYNALRDCVISVDGANAIGVSYTGGANSNVLDNCRILPSVSDASQTGIYVNAYAIELNRPDIEAIAGTAILLDAGATSNRPTQLFAPYLENPAGTNIKTINGGCPPAMGSGRFTLAKPAAETRTSNTTVTQDNDLVFTMIPGRVYQFRMLLIYDGAASAAADLKCSLIAQGAPAFLQATWRGLALASLTTPQGQATAQITQTAGSLVSFPTAGTGAATAAVAVVEGAVGPGSGGTFALQWAQRVSSPTATTLYQGSVMSVEQIS